MKKLIALMSLEGKTKEQLATEMYEAVQKYFRVEKEVLADMAKEPSPRKSAEEAIAEYRKSEPEQYNPPQGMEEATVSLTRKPTSQTSSDKNSKQSNKKDEQK